MAEWKKILCAIDFSRTSEEALKVAADVARRFEGQLPQGFEFRSAEEIWNEVRSLWPAGAGVSYARLEQDGIQWPCPEEGHPGTGVLPVSAFASGQRAALRRIDFRPSSESADDHFPFVLITGRTLYAFNAGTMTSRTPNRELRPGDFLDISPEDARRCGIFDGRQVRVRSRHGDAVLPVRITDAVRSGELFATFHADGTFLNRVTGDQRDSLTNTPEYKVTGEPGALLIVRTRAIHLRPGIARTASASWRGLLDQSAMRAKARIFCTSEKMATQEMQSSLNCGRDTPSARVLFRRMRSRRVDFSAARLPRTDAHC